MWAVRKSERETGRKRMKAIPRGTKQVLVRAGGPDPVKRSPTHVCRQEHPPT